MTSQTFKTRFKAWWDGYDASPAENSPQRSRAGANRPHLQLRCRFSADIETMHLIFGEGRSLPLPADPLIDLGMPNEDEPEKLVLLIGAETGLPAIHLASSYNVQVTALEPDRTWFRTATDIARDVEGGGRFQFGPVDLANVELTRGHYDAVSSRLLLHRYPARDSIYRRIERSLRKKGTLSLLQFVAAEDASLDEVSTAMVSSLEPEPPHLLSQVQEMRMLVESGLRPQVMEDVTNDLVDQLTDIFRNWQELTEKISMYDQHPRMLQAMLAQVQHWQSRLNLMNSGDLQAVQFRSIKRPNELG